MNVRFYSQALSQASKTMAMGILMVGLILMGLGILIAAFPKVFAYVVAAILGACGLGLAGMAIKIFLIHRDAGQDPSDGQDMRSPNVQVRAPDRP
ncbi:MAG: hypothetical protein KBE04_07340 [Phycisphaerae bacterium]|nr:hypothetical protein [Phycisphaerae bacterium]